MDNLLEGPQDLSLNTKGKDDIHNLADVFEKLSQNSDHSPTSILHSPLIRCVETGHILKDKLSIKNVKEFPALQEVYRGDWSKLEGEAKVNAMQYLKEKKYSNLEEIKVEDAEKWEYFLGRIETAIDECLSYDEKCPIIVTHGQVVKEFLKLKKCWFSVESKWKGENRPPLQVNYSGSEWSTKLIE